VIAERGSAPFGNGGLGFDVAGLVHLDAAPSAAAGVVEGIGA